MTPIEPVSLGFSLLAIIAFIPPFVYHSKKRKRQETSLRQQFFHAAQEYGLDLHQLEFCRGRYAIGLDERKKPCFIKILLLPGNLFEYRL